MWDAVKFEYSYIIDARLQQWPVQMHSNLKLYGLLSALHKKESGLWTWN